MHTYPVQALFSAAAGVLSRSSGDTVKWTAPTAGEMYGPGETLVGQWETTQHVVSPSFKLCDSGEEGCGTAVWPEVKEQDGSYAISLVLPNVTEEATYHLQMKDDFGKTFNSPKFSLSPSALIAPDGTDDEQADPSNEAEAGATAEPASSPTGAPVIPSSDDPSNPSQVVPNADPKATPESGDTSAGVPVIPSSNVPSRPSQVVPNVEPNHAQAPISVPSSLSSPYSPYSPPPYATYPSTGPNPPSVHNTPPTAAIAVPLSLAGAILLAASALALHHKRTLAREQANDAVLKAETMKEGKAVLEALSRRTTMFEGDTPSLGMGSNGGTLGEDIEKALLIRALLAEKQGGHTLPNAYAAHVPQQPHLAHYVSPSSAPVPPAPVPRQRTREAYSPASPVGYPGEMQAQTVTRTISDASSITSSLLSSYLPSPTDLPSSPSHPEPSLPSLAHHERGPEPAFHEVPLSPRIPPVLHVRVPAPSSATPVGLNCEKALPPSPRTAGMYDKVARVLGVGTGRAL